MSFQDCTVQDLQWDAAIGVITGADILTPASSINTQNLPVTISASLFMPDINVHSYYHLILCRSAVLRPFGSTCLIFFHGLCPETQSGFKPKWHLNLWKAKHPRERGQKKTSTTSTTFTECSNNHLKFWIMGPVSVNDLSLTAPLCADTSELQDVEIAHEIQEQLVRQAEQQRKQEEKDAVRTTQKHMSVFSSLPRISGCTHQLPDLSWCPLMGGSTPFNSNLLFVTHCSTYVINERATPLQTEFAPSKWSSNWRKSTVTLVFCRPSLAGCRRRRWKRRGRDRSSWKPTLRRSTLRITEVGKPRLVYVLMNSCLQGNETRSCSLFLDLEFGFAQVCFWCCLEPETVSEEVIREASVC